MRLSVEPDVIALAPGDVTDLLVRVHNDGEDTCTPFLQVRGVDPADVLLPAEVVAVPVGSVMTAVVRVRAAVDAVPGEQRIAVAVEDLDGGQGMVSATTVLRIGARPDVAVEVDPVATVGRRGAKATTILRNRSDRRLQVDLEGRGDGVRVLFRPARVTLDPGETKRVRTRMRRAERSWFSEIRHGAVITARGIGAPASTTATFTQKPSVPRPAVRTVAALTALAVWVAASVVVFDRINAEPEAGPDVGIAAGPVEPGPGRTSASGLGVIDAEPGVSLPVVIQGTVEGPRDPSGTTVTAERIGFGDEGTTTGLTKVVALAEVKLPRGNVLDVVRTTTDERGRFRIASGLVEDAFYRVTAVRAGFEVGSFIVSTSAETPEVTLAVALEPASGSLAGTVKDSTGAAVGGATVLVTDGSATYTTVTPSEGDSIGRWVLEGLATPATYQVIVSRRGFAAQTLIVELDGGQARTGVDAVLTADLGTIVGRVTDANRDPNQPNVAQGVGALTVTLAGPEARETRTLTIAGDLRGTFDLPGLPYGDYKVTFSGEGWVTREAEVTVDRGLVRLDATATRSTGLVQGWVWQTATGSGAFQGECRYPRIDQRDGDGAVTAGTAPRPCGGVSVTVTSDEGDVFATASANATGFFQIGGVPAGAYTLTLARPGYVSHVRAITVQPGGTFELNPDRTAASVTLASAVAGTDYTPLELAAPPAVCAGTVVLTLIDFRDGRGVDPIGDASAPGVITVSDSQECDPAPRVTRVGTSGAYRIDNVPFGPRTITVADPGDPVAVWAYEDAETTLQVSPTDFTAVSLNIVPKPRDLTIPAGMVRLQGPAAASRSVTLEVIDSAGNLAADPSVFTPFTITGGGTNPEQTIQLLSPDRDLRLRIVGGDVAGVFRGYASVGGGTGEFVFELPPGLGPYTLPLREVVRAERTGGVATLTTAAAHGLAVGDEVLVTETGAFDSVNDSDTRTITAVTDDTVTFALAGPDIAPITLTEPGNVRRTSEPQPLRVVAQTRVSGAVRGVSADATSVVALPGATVTLPAGADGLTAVVVPLAGDGTFSATLRSGEYGNAADLDPITVSAPGYETRSFLPHPGRVLAAPTEVLRPAADAPFLLYPALAGAAEDVGLDPSPRRVTVTADLLGGTGSERTFRFELRSGTLAGEAVRAADGTLRGTVASSDVTLGVGTARPGSATFDLGQVPVGTYTLVAVPASGERIALRSVSVDSGGGTVTSPAPGTYTLVVPAGVGDITLGVDVRARTLLSGRILGFDLPLLSIEALGGATVTAPGDATLGVVTASTTTASDGTFSIEVDAADYGSGTLGPLTVTASGYDTRSFTGSVADSLDSLPGVSDLFLLYAGLTPSPLPDGDVGLDPSARAGIVKVELTTVAGEASSRSVTVRLTAGEIAGQPTRRPGGAVTQSVTATPGAGAPGGVVSTSALGTFAFADVPVGSYTLEIVGDHVRTLAVPVTIGPDGAPFDLGTVQVVARTELTVSVTGPREDAGVLVDGPLGGVTVGFVASLAASTTRDGLATASGTTIANGATDEGTLTVWIDTGAHAAGSITLSADGYSGLTSGPLTFTGTTGTAAYALAAAPRAVEGTVGLLGPTGQSRDVVVELWEDTGRTDFSTSADRVAVAASATVTVGGAVTYTFPAVPIAADGYTLRVIGAGGDPWQVVASPIDLLIEPGDGSQTVPRVDATARTQVTVTTTGVQVDPGSEALLVRTTPLAGVTVTPPTAGDPEPASATTGSDGTASFVIDAGDYTSVPVVLSLGGYVAGSLAQPLEDRTETVSVELLPAATEFTGSVVLAAADGATRTVTVDVCAEADTSCATPLRRLTGRSISTGTSSFSSSSLPLAERALDVGVYRFRVSGTGVTETTVLRVIGPATAGYSTTPIDVVATVELSGTITEPVDPEQNASGFGGEGFGPEPVPGVLITASDGSGGVVTATTADDGTYTLTVPSGTWSLTATRSGYSASAVVAPAQAFPGDDATLDATLATDGGFQVVGNIATTGAGSVGVVATPDVGSAIVGTVDGSGSYRVEGLAGASLWEITFTHTPDGGAPRTVIRWIDTSAPRTVSVRLDQDLRPEAIATLAIGVTNLGPTGSTVAVDVALVEGGPFKSLRGPSDVPGEWTATAPVPQGSPQQFNVQPVVPRILTLDGQSRTDRSLPPARFTAGGAGGLTVSAPAGWGLRVLGSGDEPTATLRYDITDSALQSAANSGDALALAFEVVPLADASDLVADPTTITAGGLTKLTFTALRTTTPVAAAVDTTVRLAASLAGATFFADEAGTVALAGAGNDEVTLGAGSSSVDIWARLTRAGSTTLTASPVSGLSLGSPTDTVTVGAASASVLALSAGDGQTAAAGSAVAVDPQVRVTDAYGNPVAGVSVTFTTADGSASPTGAVTDAQGLASTTWTLDAEPGPNSLTASVTGTTPTSVTFTATGELVFAPTNARSSTGTIQTWTVPSAGDWTFTVAGAQGGSRSSGGVGGRGAIATATFSLAAGTTVRILAGAQGPLGTTSTANQGGGGGSFIWIDGQTTPLLVAGGGGGASTSDGLDAVGFSVTPVDYSSAPGSSSINWNRAAGWALDGDPVDGALELARRPLSSVQPGRGGTAGGNATPNVSPGAGGFGGGGGGAGEPSTNRGAGGGGGYLGGVGQRGNSIEGGGGSSFVAPAATASSIALGAQGNTGDGRITIVKAP